MDEANTANKKFRKELKSGTVSLVLLSILQGSEKPMYGYQIMKSMDGDHNGEPVMSQGALYPVLRSLEKSGLLESEVEPSVAGPPRRYYRITGTGREILVDWTAEWVKTRDFVDTILKGNEYV